MASQFDDSDFVDREYQSSQHSYSGTPAQAGAASFRPPSREELDGRVGDTQRKLAELKRAQEELERERATLEEARRRRLELQTGREEMLQALTRGVSLMEQAEFAARRDAEQMAKTLNGLRDALAAVQGIREDTWTQENWNVELIKALAHIENSRMEWNQARLKWSMLDGQGDAHTKPSIQGGVPDSWSNQPFWELCKIGAALTWPVAVVGLVALIVFLVLRLP